MILLARHHPLTLAFCLASHQGQHFPLGFETGDPALDRAATVLRMLYVKDLRALQSQVDQTLVSVQEFTANPRTDSKLGKVGR